MRNYLGYRAYIGDSLSYLDNLLSTYIFNSISVKILGSYLYCINGVWSLDRKKKHLLYKSKTFQTETVCKMK